MCMKFLLAVASICLLLPAALVSAEDKTLLAEVTVIRSDNSKYTTAVPFLAESRAIIPLSLDGPYGVCAMLVAPQLPQGAKGTEISEYSSVYISIMQMNDGPNSPTILETQLPFSPGQQMPILKSSILAISVKISEIVSKE